MNFIDDLPPTSTLETPKDKIESAIHRLWDGRNMLIIGKKTAVEFDGYEVDLVEDEHHIFFTVKGNVSRHDMDTILTCASAVMGELYYVKFER